MNESSQVFSRNLGIPIEDMVITFQQVARDVLKETKGELSKIHAYLLGRYREEGALTERDVSNLTALYGNVEAAQRGDASAKESAHARYQKMIRDTDTSELASVLARLYRALVVGDIVRGVPRPRDDDGSIETFAARPNPITALAVNIALGGFAGLVVSGGNPGGAIIGGFIGAINAVCVLEG